ncbi:Putative ribonuclease H protein At1g65750 [Linum grandiflorum]
MVRTPAGELQTLQSCPPKPMAATRRFGWQKPQPGWIKINVDGSSNEGLNSAAFGGVLRDEDGGWIAGFCQKTGIKEVFLLELLAIRNGLSLARAWGYNQSCKLSHTMREGNKLADLIAKLGHESNGKEEILFATPPTSLIGAWQEDKACRLFLQP